MDDVSFLQQYYSNYKPGSDKPKPEIKHDTNGNSYIEEEVVVRYINNDPVKEMKRRVVVSPPNKIEDITDGSWPPIVGKLYNGKGPIVYDEKNHKYGFFREYPAGQGGVETKFIAITEPTSTEEKKAKEQNEVDAKTFYETNGPIGAPKVLAAVHVAYPRSSEQMPAVHVGSFVLAFYTLQPRTKTADGKFKNGITLNYSTEFRCR